MATPFKEHIRTELRRSPTMPSWFPFALVSSFFLVIGLGQKAGWKTAATPPAPPPPQPPPGQPPVQGLRSKWIA